MRKYVIALAMLFLSANAVLSIGQRRNTSPLPEDDKTLSPYFLVLSNGGETERLPLKSTSADVRIEGVIADVTVKQVYKNEGKTPIEAIYVFPGSTKAAVYGMTMKIGERILVAEIQKKEEARATYEKAKSEGRSASLLEQERPNVFQMSVANIMPGDLITVELKYTELLVPESGVYEFVYPTVVGPRYSNKKADNAKNEDKFVETPYQHEGEKPLYSFDINVQLNAGMPVDEIFCNSHKVKVDYENADKLVADIKLDPSESSSGNRDYILSYRLSGGQIQSGLLLSEGTEKFFLLMLQPPKKVEEEAIPFREYIFVVDVSGSMWGFPLTTSKEMMKELLDGLRPGDMFNVMLFAGGSELLSCSSIPATKDNIDNAIKLVESQQGGGATELLPALKKVFNVPKQEGYSRTIVLLTDGYVDVEEEVFDLITKNQNDGNVFAFGIGSAVNRFLIEGISRCGMGEPFIVTKPNQCKEQAAKFLNYIKSPVLTNIKLDFNGFNAYDIEPLSIPDVFQEKPVIIFGKWRDDPTGKIVISGISGRTPIQTTVEIQKFATHDTSQALKYLWARHKIARLGDYNQIREDDKRAEEITNLGLKYNLLTKYTSFVAVDYLSRNKDSLHTVKQALPMPEGVSDNAVGRGSGGITALTPPSSGVVNSGSGFVIRGSRSSETKIKVDGLSTNFSRADALEPSTVSNLQKEEIPDNEEFEPVFALPKADLASIKSNLKYPEMARKAGIEGDIIVKALIDKSGNVIKTKVISTNSEMLVQTVIDAIKKSKFTSAIQNSQPILAWITIPVKFSLKGNDVSINKDRLIIIDEPPKPEEIEFKPTKKGTLISVDGLEIRELIIGTGNALKFNHKVTIHYKAFFDNCTIIEDTYKKNEPLTFVLGENPNVQFILQEGISGMKVGGKRIIYNRTVTKPNQTKFYEVELIKVE